MKTRLLIGASAHAVIITEHRSMDVLLNPGRGVQQSLRETVAEIREKAQKDLDRADFIESAIVHFAEVKNGN